MVNQVVHFELIGPDPDRLRAFYSALFGWHSPAGAPVSPAISAASQYSFITPEPDWKPAAGGIGGGEGFTAHAIFYVGVESVAETLRAAEALGATVVLSPQRNEGGELTVAHFADPAGNLVGIAGAA